MKKTMIAALAGAAALAMPQMAAAEGNLATLPTDLELSIDSRTLTFSQTTYEIETGKYYRWTITHDGLEEMQLHAPELFRNSWINQVVIGDMEVSPLGLYGIEFDDAGDMVIFFIPIRTGDFDFYVPGYEERGLLGTFVVR